MIRSGAKYHPLGAYDQENDYLDSIGLYEAIVVVGYRPCINGSLSSSLVFLMGWQSAGGPTCRGRSSQEFSASCPAATLVLKVIPKHYYF